jgi:UDP-glucose 4-epimerase
MTVLVTGGGGFIGSYLARELIDQGTHVRVSHGSLQSLERSRINLPDAEHIYADIGDQASVSKAVDGVEVVYHLAGTGSPGSPHTEDLEILRVNVAGTCSLLQQASQANVKRFVFASSASVYGDSAESPKVETMQPSPKSVYAASKLAAENLCAVFHAQRGLDTRVLRYFNVYGAGQGSNMVVPNFIRKLSNGETLTLFGDGQQTRDFVHVSDVVKATICAGQQEHLQENLDARLFNIGSGQPMPIRTVVVLIAEMLGVEAHIEYLPERAGEIRESVADIKRAKQSLGFSPSITFADGLFRTMEVTHNNSSLTLQAQAK